MNPLEHSIGLFGQFLNQNKSQVDIAARPSVQVIACSIVEKSVLDICGNVVRIVIFNIYACSAAIFHDGVVST